MVWNRIKKYLSGAVRFACKELSTPGKQGAFPRVMSHLSIALSPPIVAERRKPEVSISTSATISDDALCMRRFLAGDDAAFAELFDRHHHRLHVYCLKFTGDAEQAEDLTQELWERVIRLRLSPQEIHTPLAFFFRIARNLCINHLKARRHTSSLDELPESEHPAERESERSEMEDIVQAALAKLPFEYREVLLLNTYCGYRFEEIATMLGKSADSIWMRASRARAKLRKIVTEMMEANSDIPEQMNQYRARGVRRSK